MSDIPFKIVTVRDVAEATLRSRCRMSDTGCWEWTAGFGPGGYGQFQFEGQNQRAHRVSYQLFKGDIPKGHVVRHDCDNPARINPNHLRTGTMKDNAADREARGRRDVKGEQIGTSKLTAAQALEIKTSKLSLSALAAKFGIDKSNAHLIRAGKSWKHLNAAADLRG